MVIYICPLCGEEFVDDEIPTDEVCTECGNELDFDRFE